jgi:hypothetical protein
MRILLVTFHFPPYNSIGSVRPSKMAKFLMRQGHEVRVLTPARQPCPQGLPLEVPEDTVTYTPWVNLAGRVDAGGRRPA